jgi:hypothetical protein
VGEAERSYQELWKHQRFESRSLLIDALGDEVGRKKSCSINSLEGKEFVFMVT